MNAHSRIVVDGAELEARWIGSPSDEDPVLVLLHDGLGSVSTWSDFPERLAAASGLSVFVYSRVGYGNSTPAPLPRPVSFMHEEAQRLTGVCNEAGIRRAIFVGHSDGGSIALLNAGANAGKVRIDALVLIAPHVFVEDVTVSSIEGLNQAFRIGLVKQKLGLHHADPEHAFVGWSEVWLSQAFRSWNIESCLPHVRVPVLVIQGEDDEFGTLRQVEAIERGAGGSVTRHVLPECGHSPPRDCPDETLRALDAFLRRIRS